MVPLIVIGDSMHELRLGKEYELFVYIRRYKKIFHVLLKKLNLKCLLGYLQGDLKNTALYTDLDLRGKV